MTVERAMKQKTLLKRMAKLSLIAGLLTGASFIAGAAAGTCPLHRHDSLLRQHASERRHLHVLPRERIARVRGHLTS